MTIRIGWIDKVTVHYETGDGGDGLVRSLCLDVGARFPRGMSIFTKDSSAVTCTDCIEWMHA